VAAAGFHVFHNTAKLTSHMSKIKVYNGAKYCRYVTDLSSPDMIPEIAEPIFADWVILAFSVSSCDDSRRLEPL
jgi:hypothetical protein